MDNQKACNRQSSKVKRFYLKLKKIFLWYLINYNIFYYLFKYKKSAYTFHNYNDYWKSRMEKEFHFIGDKKFVEGPGISGGKLEQKILLALSCKYKRVKILSSLIDPGSSVLDIGCGRGEILKYLKRANNIKGFGLDISKHAIEGLVKEGIDAQYCNINDEDSIKVIVGKYDYILLISVIEHIPKPENLLKSIKDKINKKLIVGIPNSGFYHDRLRLLFGKFPMQWTKHPADHLRFWTLRDFKWWIDWLGNYRLVKTIPDWGTPVLKNLLPSLFARSFFLILEPKE